MNRPGRETRINPDILNKSSDAIASAVTGQLVRLNAYIDHLEAEIERLRGGGDQLDLFLESAEVSP